MHITDIKVNDDHKSAIFELDKVDSNGLAIWHSFPDITHIKVNNGLKSIILNLIEIFQGISLPETTQSLLTEHEIIVRICAPLSSVR